MIGECSDVIALTSATRVAGVIGDPVRHSRSPAIHNAAYEALGLDRAFLAFPVVEGAAPVALAAMRALDIDALSVTMPHKQAVARLVDALDHDAATLDAVNCVIDDDGTLRGYNTDGEGFLRSLSQEVDFSPSGARCAVVGAGGAARAVILALARAGASEVSVINRTPERAEGAAGLAGSVGRVAGVEALEEADLVVQATPAGMPGRPELAFDPESLVEGQIVADLVYEPLETPLLLAARERGAVTVGGLGMLVHQAAIQVELLTGLVPPIDVLFAAARSAEI